MSYDEPEISVLNCRRFVSSELMADSSMSMMQTSPMDALSLSLCFDTTSLANHDAVRGKRHPPHLERVNWEIKRRGAMIGIFTNDEWAVARRGMSFMTLERLGDNPNIRLSAVAA